MSLFSGSTRPTAIKPETQLRVQSSLEGIPRTLLWGCQRVTPNLLWYGDFVAIAQKSSGGKGGGSSPTSYTYRAAVLLGLCEGPASTTGNVWNGSNLTSTGALGLSVFSGAYDQGAWGYLTGRHPDQALPYRGTSYAAAGPLDLGSSNSLPSITIEMVGPTDAPLPGLPDAAVDSVFRDFLTNAYYGSGFPADRVGDLAQWRDFTLAAGLACSLMLTTQGEARSTLNDLLQAFNGDAVWSAGVLNVIPRGDVAISGNGHSYAPPSQPLFDLSDDDYQPPQGSNPNSSAQTSTADPVQGNRVRAADVYNAFAVEFLDRSSNYNPATVYARDDAAIADAGLRQADKKTLHMLCVQSMALTSAEMMLARERSRQNTHTITVGQEYIRLEPTDIVTLTDPWLGMDHQWVRIEEITENQDYSLTMTVEEVTFGSGTPAAHVAQQSHGFSSDINAVVGASGSIVAWEPTYALAGALEVWVAAAATGDWAGCELWFSTDAESYRFQTAIQGPSRLGALAVELPAVDVVADGRTLDQDHTLSVDMSISGTQVISASLYDMLDANTLCYVGGEYLAYADATLAGSDLYSVTGLNRGLFDTLPGDHLAGAPFVRLAEDSFARIPYTTDRVGQTLFIKALGVNAYGGGRQSLADVNPIAITIAGLALSTPLPNPTALSTSLIAGLTALHWAEVNDFRNPVYEIRVGDEWQSAQVYTRVAHSPFLLPTNGTWWVSAYANPAPGLVAYSAAPASLTVSSVVEGASNVLAAWDEVESGWTGTLGSGMSVSGPSLATAPGTAIAIYEIPTAHVVDAGRVCACNAAMSWLAVADVPINVLAVTDWLHQQNILGIPVTAGFAVRPLIAIAQEEGSFPAWQTYRPGSYSGRRFKFGLEITQTDPAVEVLVTAFQFAVEAPTRTDHFVGLAVAAEGTTIQFRVDGTSTSVAFNAGPDGGSSQPSITGIILDAHEGDQLVVNAVTLSQATVQVKNGGTGVARSVNLEVKGF